MANVAIDGKTAADMASGDVVPGLRSGSPRSLTVGDYFATTYTDKQTLTDAASITYDFSLGASAKVTITADRALAAMTNPVDGRSGTLTVIQDGTGSHALSLNASYSVVEGLASDIALQGAGKRSFISWLYDGDVSKVFCWISHEA